MNREWKDGDHDVHYYYETHTGRIIGQTNKIVHTKVWLSKIIYNHNDEKYLGQYISNDHAKNSIREYWDIQDRTLLE